MKPRLAAAKIIGEILRDRGSLSSLLPLWQAKLAPEDGPLLQQLCYGTLRWQPRLNAYLNKLLDKPLRGKDSDITAALLLGLYQLEYTRIPDHAALGETVSVARQLKKPWATKLINGVLRRYQREKTTLDAQLAHNREFTSAHPRWLLDTWDNAWGSKLDSIIDANNAHPPFTLRLNTRQQSRSAYLQTLSEAGIDAQPTPFSAAGFTLATPCNPTQLPGFAEGLISVQDEAAQLAAELLEAKPGQRVLDACSAPGGKTGHILQREPELTEVQALDCDARRLARVRENLTRLGADATLIAGDGTRPNQWWDGEPFDRILLDAPCSASGIIRRHSDIKLLRSAADIERLAALQGQLLDALWPLLKPGGMMLYATCSIMPAENTEVVGAFLARTASAQAVTITADWGIAQPNGRQLLPQINGHDGFYYAKLQKAR